mmetsp:Transcript_3846/g.8911  ORF Transcript_3846/g.8911 Transcript_3846/m.8911 type:complete len:470 (+) Transcript_3846:312-1721(+)
MLAPTHQTRRSSSRFSEAAAMFRQKESNVLVSSPSLSPSSFAKSDVNKHARTTPPPQTESRLFVDRAAAVAGIGAAMPYPDSKLAEADTPTKGAIRAKNPGGMNKPPYGSRNHTTTTTTTTSGGGGTNNTKQQQQQQQHRRSFSFSFSSPPQQQQRQRQRQDHGNVPEHIRKVREREERLLRAREEKVHRAASLLQATFVGWYVRRVRYPALVVAYTERRNRWMAVLTIQKTFRMLAPRKRYRYLMGCKQRRDGNRKEIDKIRNRIDGMPSETKQDIEALRLGYESKKRELLESARKQKQKEEDEKHKRLQDSANKMIDYLTGDNDKLKQTLRALKQGMKELEAESKALSAESEKIASDFLSLQQWVREKKKSIRAKEASHQKCIEEYLPNHEADLELRNRHCVTENRVKESYKLRLEKILLTIERRKMRDPGLVEAVRNEMESCRKGLLGELPENPVPEGLENRLDYR